MKTKLHYFITVVLLCFWGSTAFGQVTENVSFRSDGFYGQVTLTVKKSYYMEPYFNASPQKVVINSFENGKYDAILRAAGITFPYVLEKGAGFEFKAEAVIRKRDVLYGGFEFFESVPVSFSTSNTLGSGQVFPPFSEKAKKWLINGGNENSIVGKGLSGGEAAWGKYGEIDDIEVTRAYLDTKIKSVIAQHQSKEKDRASRFEALISEAKTIASGNNFIDARKRLAEAQKIMQGQEEKNTAREAEKFIDDKEQEKEKSEQKQKEEEEQKEKEAQEKVKAETENQEMATEEREAKSGSSSSGNSNKEEDKSDKKDNDKESSDKKETKKQTIYIPKTNQQLYEELEAMTKANPGMLNDPKVRKRLRDYKALAGMDSRNRQDLQTYNMVSGGRYNPAAIDYLSRSTVTNANIAAAESAVGDVVDAATGAVNSYFAEKERKEDARTAEYRQQQANAKAKKDAIKKWENDLLEARKVFEEKIAETIEKDGYTLMATIPDLPITYETEKYIAGETYYKGNYAHFTPPSFENETVVMKDWSAPKTYNLYVVELNGLYGILGDNGETIFPPQFEGIYVLQDVEKRARFLVNINNKWGETLADATITEDIKYDGIWYTPDRKNKVLRYDDLWGIKPLDSNQPLKEFTTSQITDLYPGGLIPVYNTLLKSYNDKSGSYSLAADGNVYVWGQAEEKGVIPISYESARRGQTVERLFKINGEWYITANYGTSSMFMVTMPSIFMVPVLRDTENGRKWGVLNQEGEVVVPFEHDYIRRTSNGFATEKGDYNLRN